MGYYITHSGKKIDILNILENDICIEDIAHHLSSISLCRYGGTLPFGVHYSVAQHSLQLMNYFIDECKSLQRAALMHDASEAYLGDVNHYLKKHLPDYKVIETIVTDVIENKYKILPWREVKEIDGRITLDEAHTFIPEHLHHFTIQMPGVTKLGVPLVNEYGKEQETYNLFLYHCKRLGIKD